VNIGTFAMPLHPASRPLVDVLKENAEKIILADQLGFAEAWIGEHFSAATEPICSPLMFFGFTVATHQTDQIGHWSNLSAEPAPRGGGRRGSPF